MQQNFKFLFVLVTLVVSSILGHAQSKEEDLSKLFQLMKTEKMIDQTMSNVTDMLKQQLQSYSSNASDIEKFDKYIEFMIEETKSITNKMMQEDMPAIYERHFTHEEIKDLIAFYESSTGQKMLEKTGAISKETMAVMMEKYIPDLQSKLKAKLEEMD